MVHWCLSLNFNMWHRHPCFTWIDVNWVSMYHMHMHCVLIWCLQLLTELPLFNFPYLVHVVFFQKRGRCKGSIPLSSVKAVEFVDDTAFDQNKKFCFCFQVCTPFFFVFASRMVIYYLTHVINSLVYLGFPNSTFLK